MTSNVNVAGRAELGRALPAGGAWWFWGALVATGTLCALALVLAGQPALALLAVLAMPAALAIAVRPDLATVLVVFLIFTNAAVVAVHFHGLPIAGAAIVPLLLMIPIGRDIFFRGEKILITPALLAFASFFAVQTVGTLMADRPELAAPELMESFLEGILLYALVANAVRRPEVFQKVVWALVVAGAFMGGIVFVQQLGGSYTDNFGGFAQVSNATFDVDGVEDAQPRLGGSLGSQNRFAQVLSMLFPLALFLYWTSRSWRGRAVAIGSFVLIGIGFSLAFSRGAAVGVGLTFGLMALLGHFKPRHYALLGACLLAVGLAVPQYGIRLAKILDVVSVAATVEGPGIRNADGATRSRVTEMWAAGLAFADNPIVGLGPGQYGEHYREYALQVGLEVKAKNRSAHSMPLDIAAEQGLLGLLTFGLVLFFTFRDLMAASRRWRPLRPDIARLITGISMALVAYLAVGLFLHFAYIRYFWLMMGIAGGASYLMADSRGPERRSIVFRPVSTNGTNGSFRPGAA